MIGQKSKINFENSNSPGENSAAEFPPYHYDKNIENILCTHKIVKKKIIAVDLKFEREIYFINENHRSK